MNKKILKIYTDFRKSYKLDYKPLEVDGENIFFEGELVEDAEKKYAEGEKFLNVGYNFKLSNAKVLSNLYPLEFKFKGKKVKSIEGVLQGIKYQDKKIQNLVLNYSGIDAYHTRCANSNDFWGNSQLLYWQGKPIKRDSEEYQLFIDELYISALSNPLYKNFLIASGEKYLLHHIGCEDLTQTVLTRYELELRLNSLRDFVKKYNL